MTGVDGMDISAESTKRDTGARLGSDGVWCVDGKSIYCIEVDFPCMLT